MADASSPADVRRRFPVDLDADPAFLDERMAALLRVLPTGHAERLAGFGFSFRRETDAFSAIAAGPTLGTALLLLEYSRVVPFLSYVALTLAAAFVAAALWLLGRFARNALARTEICSEGAALVLRSFLGRRATSTRRYDARDIVAVLVQQTDGQDARVLLGGPRHALIAEVFRTRPLDPERLAPWMAEMLALVARHASLALRP